MRTAVLFLALAVASCGSRDTSPPSGASSSSTAAAAPAGAVLPARPGKFEVCSGTNDKWVGFRRYEGASMLCCGTSDGLPHVFTTVFATRDSVEAVRRFYEAGSDPDTKVEDRGGRLALLRGAESRSLLTVDPVEAAPDGCKPASSDGALIVISDRPPFPH